MPKTSDKKQNFAYFYAYLSMQIDEGVKQKKIADYINKPAPYVNKIYLGNQKSCPLDIQRKIADFFGISFKEMLNEGKKIYEKQHLDKSIISTPQDYPYFTERRSKQPNALINQLHFVASGIDNLSNRVENVLLLEKKIEKLEKRLEIHEKIFKELQEGVTFYNADREFVYSSNRWDLLTGLEHMSKLSLESILLHLQKSIENHEEVIHGLLEIYRTLKEKEIILYFKNGKKFLFRAVPIFKKELFEGYLIICTPL